MSTEIANQNISLTLGIPADSEVGWTLQILSKLDKPDKQVRVVISRWIEKPLTLQELKLLNGYFPSEQVLSSAWGTYAVLWTGVVKSLSEGD